MTLTPFEQFVHDRYSQPPGDFSWNSLGFNNSSAYSDISAHLPFLEFLARQCKHITEFGTRNCFSTAAFIKGCPKGSKVVSYDIKKTKDMEYLSTLELPCLWQYHLRDTTDSALEIEETDLLFIDSLHTADQVRAELLQANKVQKWICFHDSTSQRLESLDRKGQPGILPAIEEFLDKHPEWNIVYEVSFNHGLMLIEKGK